MKRKRFKEEQIVQILKEADASGNVREVCRRHNITEQTLYRWPKKYADMDGAGLSVASQNSEMERRHFPIGS